MSSRRGPAPWSCLVAALLAASCASARREPSPPAGRQAPIISGTMERGYPSVVAVVRTGFSGTGALCSGSVIGRYAVLTAKHCVFEEVSSGVYTPVRAPEFLVVAGYDLTSAEGITGTWPVYDVMTTPGSDIDADSESGNDLAVVLVAGDIGIPPLGTAGTGPHVGDAATIVGFGRTSPGTETESSAGIKYSGSTGVSRTWSSLFETEGASWGCNGDSGGPAIGADGNVVGVASWVWEGCVYNNTYFARVASHASLLAEALAFAPPCEPSLEVCDGSDNDCNGAVDEGCTPLGEPCSLPDECADGTCELVEGESLCVRECDPTAAIPRCPYGFHCEETSCGVGRCVPGDPGAVASGEECTSDAECDAYRCVTVAGAQRCAHACRVDGDPCADGEVCLTGDAECGSCIPAELAGSSRPFGSPCDMDAHCVSGVCLDGICTQECGGEESCPGGYHCRAAQCVAGALGGPGADCVLPDDCGATAPDCVDVDGEHSCAAPCGDGGECSVGLECGPSGAGDRCLPPGFALGEACSANHECRTGICAGVCTRICSEAAPCPSSFECLPAGETSGCFPPSAPPAGPRGIGCAVSMAPVHGRRPTTGRGLVLGVLALVAAAYAVRIRRDTAACHA